jgi:hypothetical protein
MRDAFLANCLLVTPAKKSFVLVNVLTPARWAAFKTGPLAYPPTPTAIQD